MKMKRVIPNWCTWPNREYAYKIDDLRKVGARCDAWRAFFQSESIKKLRRLKGSVLWFNMYEYFDTLICEFECSEKQLRTALRGMMRPGKERPIEFKHEDIYNATAWAYLPLDCFVEASGFNARSSNDRPFSDSAVLEKHEIPNLRIGIKLPRSVPRSQFKLTHRLNGDRRFAEIHYYGPELERRFKDKRWCAEGTFPREATRQEMEAALFAKVEERCAEHMVTITD